jgi:hypothetical protein
MARLRAFSKVISAGAACSICAHEESPLPDCGDDRVRVRAGCDGRQRPPASVAANVEASWPMPLVRFLLSGVMDVYYAPKRRRVARALDD